MFIFTRYGENTKNDSFIYYEQTKINTDSQGDSKDYRLIHVFESTKGINTKRRYILY